MITSEQSTTRPSNHQASWRERLYSNRLVESTSTNELKVTDHWHEVFRDISGDEFTPDPHDDLETVIEAIEDQISDLHDKIGDFIRKSCAFKTALLKFERARMQFDSDWFHADQVVSEWVENGDDDNPPEGTFGYVTVDGEDMDLSEDGVNALVNCYIAMSDAFELEYDVDDHIHYGILAGQPPEDAFELLSLQFDDELSEISPKYYRSLTDNLEKLINVKSKLEFDRQ